jgi:hypothetical protein
MLESANIYIYNELGETFTPYSLKKAGVKEMNRSLLEWFKLFPVYVKLPIIAIISWSMFFIVTGLLDVVGHGILDIKAFPAIIAGLFLPLLLIVYYSNPSSWLLKRR